MSSPLSGLLDPQTQMPRNRLFWVLLGGVILAQLVAFWMLCRHQVEVAESRQTQVQALQAAVADCLQYLPGATVASCSTRVSRDEREMVFPQRDTAVMGASRGGTFPVSYSR